MEATEIKSNGAHNGHWPVDVTRKRLQDVIDSGQLTLSRISQMADVSSSTLSRFRKAIYEGDNEIIAAKLQTWFEARAKQSNMLLPAEPAFIRTRTAERVLNALAYGQMADDLVVIHGEAGMGKTQAIRHYQATGNNVWIATMNPTTATPTTCLNAIRDALEIRKAARGMKAADVLARLIHFFRGTRGLLIIDEAQHLPLSALETIRAIHDGAGIAVALVGNDEVYSRLTGGGQSALFAQLFSRVGKRVSLKKVDDTDSEKFAAAYEVAEPEAVAELQRIAKSPGALRGLVKTLRLATMFAKGAGETLSASHIKTAWRELGGVA